MICSDEILLKKEINHLRTVFLKTNDFTTRAVNVLTMNYKNKISIIM